MSDADLSPDKIMQTGLGFWASKTLLSAVELKVFSELAAGPEDLTTLQERLGLDPRGAADFLDALVALGFLERTDGMYSNTAETDLFLDKNKPSYIGGMLEMANARVYGFWGSLTDALRSGEPQNEMKDGGASVFAMLYEQPEKLKNFLAAMTGVSRAANTAIANKFPWAAYKTFLDVGTAQGDLAVQIALAQPHLDGSGFDLSKVRPVFESYAAAHGVAGRVNFVAGDFFKDPLPQADVVLFGHVLHNWNLKEKKLLLQKAWNALPTGGAVIVYEAIIDDNRSRNAFGLLMSLNMLIQTRGGFDFTGADCIGWMQEAGFKNTQVKHLIGPDSMVVGFK